jgi:hypothetical protein
MAYEKYKVKDGSQGELLVGVSSVDTSVVLKAGQGANFPTYSVGEKSIGTLVAYDSSGNVTKSERVTITARSTDTITVSR